MDSKCRISKIKKDFIGNAYGLICTRGSIMEKKYKIGYVPGVYDLFHVGHLNLIKKAKEVSEHLIVGVLSDDLVMHFKGKYPVIPLEQRMEIVGALKDVDEVIEVNFSNTVKMDAWNQLHYDAYFSGSDHGKEWDDEKRALQEVGSDIVFFPYTESVSSTMLKKQLNIDMKPKRVYLFGAGKIGQNVADKLTNGENKRKWIVEGFLDNSKEKHLTRVCGIPVYYPSDLEQLEKNTDYNIIISMKDTADAKEQLKKLGLTEKIIKI